VPGSVAHPARRLRPFEQSRCPTAALPAGRQTAERRRAPRAQELQAAAGIKARLVNPAGRGAGIITLTGWVALAALASLVVVIVGGAALAYRRWAGLDKPLTIVTKSGDV